MPAPLDLTPPAVADCPLLAKYGGEEAERLLGRFAAALAEVKALEGDRQLAPLLLSGRLAEVLDPLARARGLMTQRRYAVGCIGITQAGKSTTINNVLGEEVCKPGAGDACSSQPSRIVFGSRRALAVEFLTPDRLAARRQALCEQLGLATPPEDDGQLLALLDKPEAFRVADGQDPPRLREDVAYLREFLTAYARNKRHVQAPARALTDLPYDSRYEYTTHTRGGPGSEVLLVREARFQIDNPQIPPDLELCDLPGLDSKRSIDDVVTWEYLPDLHGTFLFVNVGGNLLTEGMLKILGRIHREFRGKLAGRAWIIFNKMDTLTRDHFRPGGQDNIFVTISRLLERTGIPESQVCFCSKKIWDGVDPSTRAAEARFAAQTMSQAADAPTPESCPPGLRAAWQELLKDGGISNLRRLMFQDVAETLAAQIRQDVGRLLDQFGAEFAARIAAERKRLSMGSTELQAAATCFNVVLQLRAALGTRPGEFPILVQEGERLRQALTDLFERGSPPELLANLSAAELARQFKTHARVLSQTLDNELTTETIEQVYRVIGQGLEGLPAVEIGPEQQECKAAWERFALEDRADGGWRAGLPQFVSDDLAAWLARPAGEAVDGAVYAGLMRDKIGVAVRQTVHLLRSRLRHRLGQIAHELALLTGERDAEAA